PRQRPLAGWTLALIALLALGPLAGCGSPREIGAERIVPEPPGIARPTSSLHYRDYDSADDLAQAMRWSPEVEPILSAHRGGPTPGYPENAIETFENALNFAPALVEMDIRRTVDGRLILMHDETLDRTTTGTGRVDETTFEAIRELRLLNEAGLATSYRVPTLQEALAWADGRAVLMLDVKRDVPLAELLAEVRAMNAFDRVGVIVYSLEDALTVSRLAPEALISVSADTPEEVAPLLDALEDDRLIAFVGVRVPDPEVTRLFHEAGIRTQAATFGDTDLAAQEPGGWTVYAPYLDAGADVLATDNVPAAAIAIQRASR
ncbi:MAG: glycerophosphodiester phosphodiesterase family protein, partial [Bacteroidota bacterium]